MCSIHRYAGRCEDLAEELIQLLSIEDEEKLQSELTEMGLDTWEVWVKENRAAIDSFLRASPAKRQKIELADPQQWRRLAFASRRQADLAAAFLGSLDSSFLAQTGDIRDIAPYAAHVAERIVAKAHWRIPS